MKRLLLLVLSLTVLLAACSTEQATHVVSDKAFLRGYDGTTSQSGYYRFKFDDNSSFSSPAYTPASTGVPVSSGAHNQYFGNNATGLSPNTQYWYALEISSNGTTWSAEDTLTFTTTAAPVYVSTTGNNSNPGTSASPKATIAGACAVSVTGRRLITLKAGTYPEQVVSCANTTVNEEGGDAIIESTSASDTVPTLTINAAGVEVTGITVDGNDIKRKGVHISADDVTLSSVTVKDTWNDKSVEWVGEDGLLINSTLKDAHRVIDANNPDPHLECLFAHEASGLSLIGNTFQGCAVYAVAITRCVWCEDGGQDTENVEIVNNDFYLTHQTWNGGPVSYHYTELAIYPFLEDATNYTIVNNWFEGVADNPGTPNTNEARGGILFDTDIVGGTFCANRESVSGTLGSEYKGACS
jgi:hypothetical protein